MFLQEILEAIPDFQGLVGFSVLKIKTRAKLVAVEIGLECVSSCYVDGAGQVTEEILSLIHPAGRS